jgi:hypothetical protein
MAGDVVGALKLAGSVFVPKRLAEAIVSPDSFKALRTLTLPKPGREALLGAMGTLGLLGAARSGEGEDVRPFATLPTAAMPQSQGPQ